AQRSTRGLSNSRSSTYFRRITNAAAGQRGDQQIQSGRGASGTVARGCLCARRTSDRGQGSGGNGRSGSGLRRIVHVFGGRRDLSIWRSTEAECGVAQVEHEGI